MAGFCRVDVVAASPSGSASFLWHRFFVPPWGAPGMVADDNFPKTKTSDH